MTKKTTESQLKIVHAKPERLPIICSFEGRAGSGKTLSALLFARGLAGKDGKVILIDTENHRSRLYVGYEGIGAFEVIDLDPPHSPMRYSEALDLALSKKPSCVIIDSMSHEHEGIGGILEMAEKDGLGKNGQPDPKRNLLKWARAKNAHRNLLNKVRAARAHVIMTIRIADKVKPGTDPQTGKKILVDFEKRICEPNLEFDMLLMFRIDSDSHNARLVKKVWTYEKLFSGSRQISVKDGAALLATMTAVEDEGGGGSGGARTNPPPSPPAENAAGLDDPSDSPAAPSVEESIAEDELKTAASDVLIEMESRIERGDYSAYSNTRYFWENDVPEYIKKHIKENYAARLTVLRGKMRRASEAI